MPSLSERKLVLTYVFALSLIAVLSLALHLTLNTILLEQRGSAAVVNMAGRQRMLSQRIASLVAQTRLGGTTARSDLRISVDEFERAHRDLVRGDAGRHLPAASDVELRAIYFGGPRALDAEVSNYVARARRLAAMPASDPAFSRESAALFASARIELLEDLDSVVSVHQRESETQITFLDRVQTTMLITVLATLLFEALVIFQPMIRRIMHYAKELVRLAATDPLTGVLNRRSLMQRGSCELDRARRYRRPLTLLMIDADHFKRVNDTFGHDGGDAVLIALTKALAQGLRASDILGRIGGEEFAVLLPETGLEEAELLANRLRARIDHLAVETKSGIAALTISVGVAGIAHDTIDLAPIFALADQALYEAKEHGRNRVVAAQAA